MPKSRRARKTKKNKKKYAFGDGEEDQKPVYINVIFGMGCKYVEEVLEELRKDFLKAAKVEESDLKIICHHKHFAPIRGIFSSYFQAASGPMQNSSFLTRLKEDIQAQCESYRKVLVFGHSYGGLIANRLAEELNEEKQVAIDKIQIATFGSIYIAEPQKVDRINIINYQSIGDISIRFQSGSALVPHFTDLKYQVEFENERVWFVPHKDSDNMIYVCIPNEENAECGKGFFTLGDEMDMHNNYLVLIDLLLSLRSNNLLEVL